MNNVLDKTLVVKEIFFSLQGEGMRVGTPCIFIRLSGCSAHKYCSAKGYKCDTDYAGGEKRPLYEIIETCEQLASKCHTIVWTGGEPTDQLTEEIIGVFSEFDYFQCIETSGINPVPKGIDYIVVSPKVNNELLYKNFHKEDSEYDIEELRFLITPENNVPDFSIRPLFFYLSPQFEGVDEREPNPQTIQRVINMCKENPLYNMSVQVHKLLNFK